METLSVTDSFPVLMAKHAAPGQGHLLPCNCMNKLSSMRHMHVFHNSSGLWQNKPVNHTANLDSSPSFATEPDPLPYTSVTPAVKQVITIPIS